MDALGHMLYVLIIGCYSSSNNYHTMDIIGQEINSWCFFLVVIDIVIIMCTQQARWVPMDA